MNNNLHIKWKTIAIIFIVLFVIETIFFLYVWKSGTNYIELENQCLYNICEGYDSYSYDYYEEVCYCFTDGEIDKQQFIG